MSSTDVRYSIFPEMVEYDKMPAGKFVPYSMLSGPIDYSSPLINTDGLGFRKSNFKDQQVSVEEIGSYERVNIVCGASTVFGVGASSDSTCISSLLSEATGELWLNMGVRGCNSLQEYIHLITNISKTLEVERLLFVSGINDLYLSIVNDKVSEYDYGFGTKYTDIAGYHPYRQSASIFFAGLYGIDPVDIVDDGFFGMAMYPARSKKIAVPKAKITSLDAKIDRFLSIYQRNIMLYSGLAKSQNIDVTFILQPFINWTDKKITEDEQRVLDYLTERQRDSHWDEVRKQLLKVGVYEKISSWFSEQMAVHEIRYYNSNKLFSQNEKNCFVDSVHLSDEGNRLIVEKYLGS